MKERNKELTYEQAMHGMQSGVAMEIEQGLKSTSPKHLRVGVNSALSDQSALARLLIDKGVITDGEYREAIRIGAIEELEHYEHRLSVSLGKEITLR